MAYKGSKAIERELIRILNSPQNSNKCGECGTTFPSWCSISLGVFLCGRCASVHRKLLGQRGDNCYSDVRSLTMDRWSSSDLDELASSGGNKRNRTTWNPKNEPFPFDGDEDKTAVEKFIRDKYVLRKFRPDSQDRSFDDETRTSSSWSRPETSRSSSTRITHSNRPSAHSSASSSAVTQANNPPLPRRPASNVGPRPAVFDGTGNAPIGTRPAVFDGLQQQQFLDPATGIVYVGQAQEQALYDQQSSQQQQALLRQQMQQQALYEQQALQQQALYQQQMQQQMQSQAEKNALLSLYQRPDLYTSAVEITPSHPQYQQIMQMQMQMQQQQQQQQQKGPTGFYYGV
ncbi:LAME_0H16094g1_1 [Lachancea meyersii CBS 8951]|uniref:LAME_0H16094g1_1 n=1 Tax=Lachancea meyersii CBS 8951 TaxID=1266667 RepID=A0A1G4KI33_9SACH|nr:LAME_0H16094g1_1 [Lachancea meyersii CBS 8951]